MAGIFGGMTPQAKAGAMQAYAPQQMSNSDRLAMFGAMLKDIGSAGQGNNIADLQQMLFGRQQAAQQMAAQQALGGLFSQTPGGAGGSAGGSAPSLDQAAPLLARAQAAGVNSTPYLEILKAIQPGVQVANGVAFDPHNTAVGTRIGVNLQNVNGRMVDTQAPGNANVFVPSVKEGQEVVYNAQGQPIGIRDLRGNDTTFDAQMRRREAENGAVNAQSNAQQANTGASRNAYEQGTGGKPKPWDRSWK